MEQFIRSADLSTMEVSIIHRIKSGVGSAIPTGTERKNIYMNTTN